VPDLVDELHRILRERHPRSLGGFEEAMAIDPARFRVLAGRMLRWLVDARGADAIPQAADAFVRFTTDVNLHQARYEVSRRYEAASFDELYRTHYATEAMSDYLLGVYLTSFSWAHHMEISIFYQDRFLGHLADDVSLVEVAPGHGGWGVLALDRLGRARLRAYDISPVAIGIARSMAQAAGVGERATYEERGAFDLDALPASSADAAICSFLIEHLEEPRRLLAVLAHVVKPGGRVFLTGALTAAQVDHIYEFRRESELFMLSEDVGFRVTDTLSAAPRRTLPRATLLPRSMALVLRKRTHPDW
jgi:2-polyprenyl-3-methyl-5-hydroxy-6-metoxy-1,4-benzoquinol methylase